MPPRSHLIPPHNNDGEQTAGGMIAWLIEARNVRAMSGTVISADKALSTETILALRDLLTIDDLTRIVDIGASEIEGDPPYRRLVDARVCRVIGFEPQTETISDGLADEGRHVYLPYAVGDGGQVEFNVCGHSGWSSTLRPSAATMDILTQFQNNARVVSSTTMDSCRLDDVAEIKGIDFLKIDIQGGELAVFRHGRGKLSEALFVQTEVSFMPLYDGQPSFGEIDVEMRQQGFIPHFFSHIKRVIVPPLLLDNEPFKAINQVLDGDIVYVRDFRFPERMSSRQLKQLALLAHGCFASFDLAYRMVMLLVQRGEIPETALEEYIALLG